MSLSIEHTTYHSQQSPYPLGPYHLLNDDFTREAKNASFKASNGQSFPVFLIPPGILS